MQCATADLALQANKAKLLAVFEKYGVTNPRLFGSVARGEADAHSDIDILVCRTAPMDYAAIARLRREVGDALGWPAHVVFESALKPQVWEAIQLDLRSLL
ncbi:MAG: nucleotidyltransferase family protein [Devosia sp.]